ncbi:response regulator transcription factor (plasmid) [Deinococcus taeanensis]|uniref:response regulator transcription factor n=1 Tax=Deinococcus taeanensis TaxID=2737050 RepID=UPI001CDC967E|nr:response regulator transcription factor [Deinococcus taeanensis]UBV44169.1 response regulator transcription factor [Deinococcus taeanensis]
MKADRHSENRQRTILVIEDDPDIARLVQLDMEDAGFRVVTAVDGAAGLQALEQHATDLVILDLGLPDVDGETVARQVRRTSSVPIVVLTALDGVERKIELLCAGVDAYVTKPFDPADLTDRVHVALAAPQHAPLTVGRLRLLPDTRRCVSGDQDVPLSSPEFDLLWLLAQRPGYLHSRDELQRSLWREQGSAGDPVDGHLRMLKRKLGEAGAGAAMRVVRDVGVTLLAVP